MGDQERGTRVARKKGLTDRREGLWVEKKQGFWAMEVDLL